MRDQRNQPPLALAGYTAMKCLGSGFAIHDAKGKQILLSGASVGFGPADHAATAAILKSHYTGYRVEIGSAGR